jgi:hypothetical protein
LIYDPIRTYAVRSVGLSIVAVFKQIDSASNEVSVVRFVKRLAWSKEAAVRVGHSTDQVPANAGEVRRPDAEVT